MSDDLSIYSVDKVRRLIDTVRANPTIAFEPQVRHSFADGVYLREMFMPAGTCVVGKLHLKQHLCIVLGDVDVYSPAGLVHLEGYHVFASEPGAQRTLFARTDTWWTTVHANPDNGRDIAAIEARNVSEDFDLIKEH